MKNKMTEKQRVLFDDLTKFIYEYEHRITEVTSFIIDDNDGEGDDGSVCVSGEYATVKCHILNRYYAVPRIEEKTCRVKLSQFKDWREQKKAVKFID